MKRLWLVLCVCLVWALFAGLGKIATSTAQTTTSDEVTIIPLTTPTNAVGVNVRSVSNDGKRFVFDSINDYDGSNVDSNREIFIYDLDTGALVQLTNTKDVLDPEDSTRTLIHITNNAPTISGDGTKIVFTSNAALTAANNDDGNQEVYLIDFPRNATSRTAAKITRLTNTSKNTATEVITDVFTNYGPTINNDGSVIAFLSTRSTFNALENGTVAFSAAKEGANGQLDPDGNAELFTYNTSTKRYGQVTITRDNDTIVNFVVKGFTISPHLSGDGKKLVFLSAYNYPGATANKNTDFNGEIFLYDVGAAANTVTQVTDTSGNAVIPVLLNNGAYTVLGAAPMNVLPAFSHPINDNGSLIVFESAGNLGSSNSDKTREIWLYNVTANTFTRLTDQTASSTPTQDELKKLDYNFQPNINSTGTFITFGSTLNLTPATTSSVTSDNADASRELFRYNIAQKTFRQLTFSSKSSLLADARGAIVTSFPDAAGSAVNFSFESDLLAPNLTLNPEAFRALVIPVTEKNSTAAVAVNAASYDNTQVARGSLVAIFGTRLANSVVTASSLPLPYELGGVRVTVAGIAAQLVFVSPGQINVVFPNPVAIGDTVTYSVNNNGVQTTGTIKLVDVAPGVFSATGDGTGKAVVQCGSVSEDGQTFVFSAPPCAVANANEDNLLVIYGTGWRNGAGLTVTIGDTVLTPTYVGPQPNFPGLDQINVSLPQTLANMTDTGFTINFGTLNSNKLTTSFKPFVDTFTVANAASFEVGSVARGSLALAQNAGVALANDTADGAAAGYPTQLKGVKVTVGGRAARLSYISPDQINFIVPSNLSVADSVAVEITNNGTRLRSRAMVADASPGLFTTSGTGDGTVVAKCAKPNADGTVTLSDPPCSVGTETAPNRLRLFGTGWRFADSLTVQISGQTLTPRFAGPQPNGSGGDMFGLDMIEVDLVQALAGQTSVDVTVTTKAGDIQKTSKAGVKISFQ